MDQKARPFYVGINTAIALLFAGLGLICGQAYGEDSFIGHLNSISVASSTVPANGDVNPYGIVRVPESVGNLREGSFLVSNFNNSGNLQGTGTTIVQISPEGKMSLFAQIDASKLPGPCPGGVGLTTALAVFRSGWVIVGSLPTSDGSSATAQAGCLLVLNSKGVVVETFSGGDINGPWDMTAFDGGHWAALFVTNILNGTVAKSPNVVNEGTIVRLIVTLPRQDKPDEKPTVLANKVIASDFPERTDPSALVIGPTGLGFDVKTGKLYVADSLDNRVAVISTALFRMSSAGTGMRVSEGKALNDPLGLTLAPNGHILTANGGDGNIVETEPDGEQVAVKLADNSGSPPGSGALFGLTADQKGVYVVDDASNTLNLLH